MDSYKILMLIIFSLILREIIVIFINKISYKNYRDIYKTECTRKYFAEVRSELLNEIRNGNLNANSYTFKAFYSIQTLIMRNPHKYSEISKQISRTLLENTDHIPCDLADTLEKEAIEWNDSVKIICAKTGAGLLMVIDSHQKIFQILKNIDKKGRSYSLLIKIANILPKSVILLRTPEISIIHNAGRELTDLIGDSILALPPSSGIC